MEQLEEFDRPLFKYLSHNDSGASVGNQAGVLIPKDMSKYFPQLSEDVSAAQPAIYETIRADLYVGLQHVGQVETRYQYQTWAAGRTFERRITRNLGPLRDESKGGDLLLIERSLVDPSFYRLTLHKAGSATFAQIHNKTGKRRWGPLDLQEAPVPETSILTELLAQETREQLPFELFDSSAVHLEVRTKRIARSQAFKQRLLPLYDFRCAVCGNSYVSPDGRREIEAAHIAPRGQQGADDARNGLALCRAHHWAFDCGLFGITQERRVRLHHFVKLEPQNADLIRLEGVSIKLPNDPARRPHDFALEWHRKNVASFPD